MRIPRFYFSDSLTVDTSVVIKNDLAHYMANVLRLKPESPIVLFNGNGNDYPSEIIAISKRSVEILIHSQINMSYESPLYLHLGQAVSKGDRMDFALQKAVELGVTEITPLITENCNVKLDQQRWEKKHLSWQKIIISACEQCQRNVLPQLNQAIPMPQWIGQQSELSKIILSPGATSYMSNLDKPQRGFRIIIGPEGGLSKQEVYNCEERGFLPVNIGARVLRTETAAIASLAILQSQFGDI